MTDPFTRRSKKASYVPIPAQELPPSSDKFELPDGSPYFPKCELPGSMSSHELEAQTIQRRTSQNHPMPTRALWNQPRYFSNEAYNSSSNTNDYPGAFSTAFSQPPTLQTNMPCDQTHENITECMPYGRSLAYSSTEQGDTHHCQPSMPKPTQPYATPSWSTNTSPCISPTNLSGLNSNTPFDYHRVMQNSLVQHHQISPTSMYSAFPSHISMPNFDCHHPNVIANSQLVSPISTRRGSTETNPNVQQHFSHLPHGLTNTGCVSPVPPQLGPHFVQPMTTSMTMTLNTVPANGNEQNVAISNQSYQYLHPGRSPPPHIREGTCDDMPPSYSLGTTHNTMPHGHGPSSLLTRPFYPNGNDENVRRESTRTASTPAIANSTPSTFPTRFCDQCQKPFNGKFAKGNLGRHVRQSHPTPNNRIIASELVCRSCEKRFQRPDARKRHEWKDHRLQDVKPTKRRKNRRMREQNESFHSTEHDDPDFV